MADRSNNERMKLALIPVLGIVLFFVLPEGESSGTPEVVSPPAASEDEGDAGQKNTQSTFKYTVHVQARGVAGNTGEYHSGSQPV